MTGLNILLVLLLAFLVASSPARNSDLWLHLASGKLLANGEGHFGTNPFTYVGEASYWVNHSWLYDVGAYLLYHVLGGTGLVLVKALLLVLAAELLLRTACAGTPLWVAAAATALSLVAMTPWLALRPAYLSYVFLALTLWLLDRGTQRLRHGGADGGPRAVLAAYGWLLPLFALWANVDDWFLLGPAVVALYALGLLAEALVTARLEVSGQAPSGALPLARLGGKLVLGAALGLAFCLANPHTIHVMEWPVQLGLSAAARQLREAPFLSPLVISPFSAAFFQGGVGQSPAGIGYWVLGLLGLLSIALTWRPASWRLALLWLAFFLLSAYQSRAIPFFAVVAGPILARNVGVLLARRAARSASGASRWRQARVGSALTAAGCLVLVTAAWPGWLSGGPSEPRRWVAEVDPSLRAAAAELNRWRLEGKTGPDAHGLSLSADSANVFAWLCPGEKDFFDPRLQQPPEVVADYLEIRRALMDGKASARPAKAEGRDWREILRRWQIHHLVLYGNEQQLVARAGLHMMGNPTEWPLLYLRGSTAIFGWRDPSRREAEDGFAGFRPASRTLAFHPPEAMQAPPAAPDAAPAPRPWWSAFVQSRQPWHPDEQEAGLDLLQFEALRPLYRRRNLMRFELDKDTRLVIGAAFAGATPSAALGPILTAQLWFHGSLDFLAGQDNAPPALPYLAVRACRRALHNSPDNANTYFVLGGAYLMLARETRERAWAGSFPYLGKLRVIQAATALHEALRLNPALAQAHYKLASLYQGIQAPDLALRHLIAYLKLIRETGLKPGQRPEQLAGDLHALEELVKGLTREVQQRLDEYELHAADLKGFDRARLAGSVGLLGKALDILLDTDVAAFGREGAEMELYLLLLAGRAQEAGQWLEPAHKEFLGESTYDSLKVQIAAVRGDYAEADRYLVLLAVPSLKLADLSEKPLPLGRVTGLLVGQAVLDGSPVYGFRIGGDSAQFRMQLNRMAAEVKRVALVHVLRGILAVEAGRSEKATDNFHQALSLLKELLPQTLPPDAQVGLLIAHYWLEQLEPPGAREHLQPPPGQARP